MAPQTAPVPSGRVTRLRAAKENTASPAVPSRGPASLLAKSKENFRKVSDKLKEKEKEVAKPKPKEAAHTESLQAFLRIRPPPNEIVARGAQPYLEPQDAQNVLMRPPPEGSRGTAKPTHVYSFDRVFGSSDTQAEFFTTTTLPLVDKLLKGENALLFAYGVSNSGKTYTIQGTNPAEVEERGVLPRAIDVVFNSIKGMESKANLKCQGLADVVLTDDDDGFDLGSLPRGPEAKIDDTVKVDRNFSYAVFVSYAEVYNDQIFDLLDSVLPSTRPHMARASSMMPRNMSMGVSGAYNSSMNLAAMANGGAGILKRRALVLKNDPEGSGKYISGLHEIRVRTREEALAVFRSGQRARQVFGTMANRESSRSHGVFNIKVVRVHNGAPEDPDSAQVSRLAIVDLAGSERTRNTATTGDRLKEAGSINKSLMVLGQCLEVLRSNQQKMAAPAPVGVKKKLAVVPFRHSKLTEIFQNFFVGDGRAVMIVHVNPYDTGFDENSHVMRFSATAREIQTTATLKTSIPTLKRQISSHFSNFKNTFGGGQKIKVMVPVIPKSVPSTPSRPTSAAARRPPPSASSGSNAGLRAPPPRATTPQDMQLVEEELEVVEEDADDDEDERDMLVDYLFEQLNDMKTQLFESEMRQAELEVKIREEVAAETHAMLLKMRTEHYAALRAQAASGEEKADMKLDILQRTMAADESFEDESFASALDETVDYSEASISDPFIEKHSADLEAEEEVSLIMSEGVADESMESVPLMVSASSEPPSSSTIASTAMPAAAKPSLDDLFDESDGDATASEGVSIPNITVDEADVSDSEGDTTRETFDSESEEEEPVERLPFVDDRAEESDLEEEEMVERRASHHGEVDSDMGEIVDDSIGSEDSEDDDEEDDLEDEDGSDDSFDASFVSSSTVSEPAPSPRKASPVKRSPVKQPGTSTVRTPAKPKRAPLRDSLADNTYDEDEDLVKEKTPATKKKRALGGKRVFSEDDIAAAAERPVAGAEVRRMLRGV